MMIPRLRIAILECDTPVGATKEKYGTYGGLFTELLKNGAIRLAEGDSESQAGKGKGKGKKPDLEISSYDVVGSEGVEPVYPDLDEVDGVLLTGSKHDSFADVPWILRLVDFTRKILAQDRVRVIGVCFGHQIIGRALGAKVDRSDKGWEISVVEVDLTERGRDVLGLETLHIHQMHRDIVYAYPSSVEHLGNTSRCEVQGMYTAKRLITVQGHPEFNGDVVSELLQRRHEQGIFNDEMYEEAMARVRQKHDGVAVGAVFLRFLLEE